MRERSLGASTTGAAELAGIHAGDRAVSFSPRVNSLLAPVRSPAGVLLLASTPACLSAGRPACFPDWWTEKASERAIGDRLTG